MTTQNIIPDDHQPYIRHLETEERSPGTIANYLRHLRAFARWLDGAPVEKSSVVRWKTHLLAAGYTPATINGMLASLHSYFHFRGWAHCRVRYLRVQRKLFRADDRALSRADYHKLLRTARARGWRQLALVVETLGATGIRVSELAAITVEAVRRGRADIHLKGKIRTILIPSKLCKKLTHYARLKKNRPRRDLSQRRRKTNDPLPGVGRNEKPRKRSRRRAKQSLSAQPASSFCHRFL